MPAEGALTPIVFEAADGAVEVAKFLSGARKSPCALASTLNSQLSDAPPVCAPTRLSVIEDRAALYADAAFTRPLIVGRTDCPATDLVVTFRRHSCDAVLSTAELLGRGEPNPQSASAESIYSPANGPVPTLQEALTTVYGAATVGLTSLPALRVRDVGTSRLKARFGAKPECGR